MPFEVTGRREPETILLDSLGINSRRTPYSMWQSRVSNWLYDLAPRPVGMLTARYSPCWLPGLTAFPAISRMHCAGGSGDALAASRAGLTRGARSSARPASGAAELEVLDLIGDVGGEQAATL